MHRTDEDDLAPLFAALKVTTPQAPSGLRDRIVQNLPERVLWLDWLLGSTWRWTSAVAAGLLLGFGLGVMDASIRSEQDMPGTDTLLFADSLPIYEWEDAYEY